MNKGKPLYVKMPNDIERDQKIIRDLLMPGSTLQSVGDEYGITRERVRQIFKHRTLMSHVLVKNNLLINSGKFRCIYCGKSINLKHKKSSKRTKYCSDKCYRLMLKYDVHQEIECKNCHKSFYRHRNWQSTRGEHNFCSMLCYIELKKNNDEWSRRWGKPYSSRKPLTLTCQICGKKFKTKNENQKFCGRKCTHEHLAKVRTKKFDKDKLFKMYFEKNMDIYQIAEAINASYSTIRKKLIDYEWIIEKKYNKKKEGDK